MSWWADVVQLLLVLVLAFAMAPLLRRLRRSRVRRQHPDGIQAHVQVVDGRVPYVPSAGMFGVLVVGDRSFSFVGTRVRGLVPAGPAGAERPVRGREWRLEPLEVVIPVRLLGGAVVEIALMNADADRLRALLSSRAGGAEGSAG